MWPPKAGVLAKWFVGFPGFLWPYNSLWLAITLVTWFFLTPPLAAMQSFELWWLSWLLVRNLVLVTLVFGGLHAYFYILKGQGDDLRFTTRGPVKNAKRFLFGNQIRDNVFFTLASAVPIITLYEALTYWMFANGYLGW